MKLPLRKIGELMGAFAGQRPRIENAPWGRPADHLAGISRGEGDLLLEGDGGPNGRYSFAGAGPLFTLRMAGERGELLLPDGREPFSADPVQTIKEIDALFSRAQSGELPYFDGGLFWLFAYEMNRYYEPSVKAPHPPECGDFFCAFYPRVRVFDHAEKKAFDVCRGDAPPPSPAAAGGTWRLGAFSCDETREEYEAKIEDVRRRIAEGDVLQVNLSRRLRAPFSGGALELFGEMTLQNPAPFGAYVDGGAFHLLSLSPELFFRVEKGEIETAPIKGTAPRGADAEKDETEKRELLASAKNRAENLMIVDLMRNDLSKICRPGTVRVPRLWSCETLPRVHHLVSAVRGTLKEGARLPEILGAVWPGGSVTGAPKVKAMEIIAEMETSARGWYCGSAVANGFGGYLTASLLIRTLTIRDGVAEWRTGGGVVADSDAAEEFEETEHKASVLKALA